MDGAKAHKFARDFFQATLSSPDRGANLDSVSKQSFEPFYAGLEQLVRHKISFSSTELRDLLKWILINIAPSQARMKALLKFMVSYIQAEVKAQSTSIGTASYTETADPRKARRSSEQHFTKAKWYSSHDVKIDAAVSGGIVASTFLQLLDLLFRSINCADGKYVPDLESISELIMPSLTEIIRLALPEKQPAALELHRHTQAVLKAWHDDGVLGRSHVLKLRRIARGAFAQFLSDLESAHLESHQKLEVDLQTPASISRLPEHHGNKRDAWYQLPASCMLPLIQDRRPIPVSRLCPVPITSAKDFDPALLDTVKAHISMADNLYTATKRPAIEIDENPSTVELNSLGLRILRDSKTGKRLPVKSYYGFSAQFVRERQESRKKRKLAGPAPSLPAPPPMGNDAQSRAFQSRAFPPPPTAPPPMPRAIHPGSIPPPPPISGHAFPPPPPPPFAQGFPPPLPPGAIPPPPPGWPSGPRDGYDRGRGGYQDRGHQDRGYDRRDDRGQSNDYRGRDEYDHRGYDNRRGRGGYDRGRGGYDNRGRGYNRGWSR